MRSLLPAAAACLVLSSFIPHFARALAAPSGSATGSPAAAAPSPGTGTGAGADDAAKHAKRTDCLKQAKSKKLVGAQKIAFIKACVGAP